jgi:hypothetical protein
VQFRAQIGQKCPLFASESAKKGVFCRGEGRLFGRPKTGVFGVRGVASSRARESRFRSRFSETKTPIVLPRSKNRTEALTLHSASRNYIVKIILSSEYALHAPRPTTSWHVL